MSGTTRGFGRAAALLLVAAPLVVAAACTKPISTTSVAISAVFLDDGKPTGAFHPCEPGGVLLIEVWDDTDRGRGRDGSAGWQVSVPTGGGIGVEQVRLLSTPDGWELHPSALQLSAFERGVTYWLHGEGRQPTNRAAQVDTGVRFTLEDLAGLAAGQVWSGTADSDEGHAVSRDRFATAAQDSCPRS